MQNNEQNPAERYNRIRRILFATANDPDKGINVAKQYLQNTYRYQLDIRAYNGMLAELEFWEVYGNKLYLTPTLDAGDHSDFSGVIENKPVRIDVTTSLEHKDPAYYAPFVFGDITYKIAHVHGSRVDILDVVEMWFPKCRECGNPMFPIVVMGGENCSTVTGNPTFEYDQVYTNFCVQCQRCDGEIGSWRHCMMKPPSEFMRDALMFYSSTEDGFETKAAADCCAYNFKIWQYFKKLVGINLMGICEITDLNQDMKHGDPMPGISFKYLNPNLKPIISGSVECDGIFELF